MNIQELFAVCENLSHLTYFEIIRKGNVIDSGFYAYLYPKWNETRIKGFRLTETGLCQIFV